MTDRVEPPAGMREREGAHWIRHGAARPTLAIWHPETRVNYPSYLLAGWWEFGSNRLPAKDACGWGYRYLGPIPSHAEFAALLGAARVALGHLTGGMDDDWRDTDPVDLLRAAIAPFEGDDHG